MHPSRFAAPGELSSSTARAPTSSTRPCAQPHATTGLQLVPRRLLADMHICSRIRASAALHVRTVPAIPGGEPWSRPAHFVLARTLNRRVCMYGQWLLRSEWKSKQQTGAGWRKRRMCQKGTSVPNDTSSRQFMNTQAHKH